VEVAGVVRAGWHGLGNGQCKGVAGFTVHTFSTVHALSTVGKVEKKGYPLRGRSEPLLETLR
jgi:hypothetical protein